MHPHSRCAPKQTNIKYFQQLLDPATENRHLSFCLYFLLAAQNLNPSSILGKPTTGWVLVGSQALLPLPRATRPDAGPPWHLATGCGWAATAHSCTLHGSRTLKRVGAPTVSSRTVPCHDFTGSGCGHSSLPVLKTDIHLCGPLCEPSNILPKSNFSELEYTSVLCNHKFPLYYKPSILNQPIPWPSYQPIANGPNEI